MGKRNLPEQLKMPPHGSWIVALHPRLSQCSLCGNLTGYSPVPLLLPRQDSPTDVEQVHREGMVDKVVKSRAFVL
jgi:hypothetical protein